MWLQVCVCVSSSLSDLSFLQRSPCHVNASRRAAGSHPAGFVTTHERAVYWHHVTWISPALNLNWIFHFSQRRRRGRDEPIDPHLCLNSKRLFWSPNLTKALIIHSLKTWWRVTFDVKREWRSGLAQIASDTHLHIILLKTNWRCNHFYASVWVPVHVI